MCYTLFLTSSAVEVFSLIFILMRAVCVEGTPIAIINCFSQFSSVLFPCARGNIKTCKTKESREIQYQQTVATPVRDTACTC
jgi:hypothetical protein